jgi:hypothetical protein
VLIGDIGGTNARFAVIEMGKGDRHRRADRQLRTIEDAIADVVLRGRGEAAPQRWRCRTDRRRSCRYQPPLRSSEKSSNASHGEMTSLTISRRCRWRWTLPGDVDPIGGGGARRHADRGRPRHRARRRCAIHARGNLIPCRARRPPILAGTTATTSALWLHLFMRHGDGWRDVLFQGRPVRLFAPAPPMGRRRYSRLSEIAPRGLANESRRPPKPCRCSPPPVRLPLPVISRWSSWRMALCLAGISTNRAGAEVGAFMAAFLLAHAAPRTPSKAWRDGDHRRREQPRRMPARLCAGADALRRRSAGRRWRPELLGSVRRSA